MTYSTTPELLKTVAALATPTPNMGVSTTASAVSSMTTATKSASATMSEFTGAANVLGVAKGVALVGALGVAALLY